MADAAPMLIWRSGTDALCDYFNQPWLDFTGRTMEQEMGNGWTEGVHPDDYPACLDTYLRAFEARRKFQMTYRLRRADGAYRWVLDNGGPWLGENGDFLGYIGSCVDITERIQAEEALQRNHTMLAQILDSMPQAVFWKDHNGVYMGCNSVFARTLGLASPEEVVGKTDFDFPATRQEAKAYIADDKEVMESNRPNRHIIEPVQHVDGTRLWVDTTKVPLVDKANRVCGVLGVYADITAQKQAEDALRENEQLLRASQSIASLGSYVLNLHTGRWSSSDTLDRIFGIDPAYDRSVEGWAALVHPDDRPLMMDHFRNEVLGQGQLFNKEYRIIRPNDHTERWVHGLGKVEYDAQGHPVRMLGTIQDITKRRQEEDKLRYLQAAVEQSANSIVITDPNGNIEYVNPAFEKNTGYTADEVLGGNPRILKSGEQDAAFYRKLWTTITSGKTWRGQFHNKRKNGSLYWESATLSPILNAKGEIVRFLAIKEDITERKIMENKLQEAVYHAEAANRAKSEFLANMSHEIRTPINGVIGMTDLLLNTDQTSEQREYTEAIQSCGDSLLVLINDILDFSKMEAGQLVLENLDFNLRESIEDTVAVLALKAQEKNLDIACLIAKDVPEFVRGDQGRLRQILFNLLGNAVKFTEHGGVTLEIARLRQTETSVTLRFDVTDTGIGIPKDQLESIFQKFTQAAPSITREFGGTGLGLAISRQLVQLFQGELSVKSVAGKGSTFSFTAAFQRSPSGANKPQPQKISLSGVKILITDDFKANRILMTELLQSWGCQVAGATDGAAALALLKQAAQEGHPFEAVIMDMHLPDADGAQLGRLIKADPALQSPPLVLLTSLGKRGHTERLASGDFLYHLPKPIRPALLKQCIAQALAPKSPAETDRNPSQPPAETEITAHHPLQILIAEDNRINRIVVVKMLEKLGHHAEAVENGREAVEFLRQTPCDLVLMDCQMPVLDGFDATRIIRNPNSGVRNPTVPIIALTARAMKQDRDLCLESGMNDYLSKPAGSKQLATVIERWCPQAAIRQDASTTLAEAPFPPDHFDREDLLKNTNGDCKLAAKYAADFLIETPPLLTQLSAAISCGDTATADRLAHTLMETSANMGGHLLSQIARQMPSATQADALTRLLPAAQAAFQTLSSQLHKEFSPAS